MTTATNKRVQLVRRTPRPGKGGAPVVSITDEGLAAIETMASNGNSNLTIARALGVHPGVFRDLRDDDDGRVSAALDTGRARLADELTDLLLKKARAGNVTCMIFLAKARLGWRDIGPTSPGTNATQVNIHIPPAMTASEFQKLVEVKRVES